MNRPHWTIVSVQPLSPFAGRAVIMKWWALEPETVKSFSSANGNSHQLPPTCRSGKSSRMVMQASLRAARIDLPIGNIPTDNRLSNGTIE